MQRTRLLLAVFAAVLVSALAQHADDDTLDEDSTWEKPERTGDETVQLRKSGDTPVEIVSKRQEPGIEILGSEPLEPDVPFIDESGVVEWTDDEFWQEVKKPRTAFVFVYAPWCNHCTSFKPKFAEAALWYINDVVDERKGSGPEPAVFAKIDGDTYRETVSDRLSIKAFPTILLWHAGYVVEYAGEQEVQALVDYVVAHETHPIASISDAAGYADLVAATPDRPVFVSLAAHVGDLAESWFNVSATAFEHEYAVFATASDAHAVAAAAGVPPDTGLFAVIDGTVQVYPGDIASPSELGKWVLAREYGYLPTVSPEDWSVLVHRSDRIVVFFEDDQAEDHSATAAAMRSSLVQAHRQIADRLMFVRLTLEESGDFISVLQHDPSDTPIWILLDLGVQNWWDGKRDMSVSDIVEFLLGALDGKVAPTGPPPPTLQQRFETLRSAVVSQWNSFMQQYPLVAGASIGLALVGVMILFMEKYFPVRVEAVSDSEDDASDDQDGSDDKEDEDDDDTDGATATTKKGKKTPGPRSKKKKQKSE